MHTGIPKNNLYPVFLKLDQLELLLVGGGNVALEKLRSLLGNAPEARITIVAPVVKEEIRQLVKNHSFCSIVNRRFADSDLNKKDLVILATGDHTLHKRIATLAGAKEILVNVADTPDLCDFYLGSILSRGNLKIAVSTNGKSPTTARRIRDFLEDSIPEEVDELLVNLHTIRNNISGGFAEKVRLLNELTRSLVPEKKLNGKQD